MTETKRLASVAKVPDKIGSEGKDVKSTFSTSSAGSPTDVLGGYIAELPISRYQYVTLVGLFTGYQDVSVQIHAIRSTECKLHKSTITQVPKVIRPRYGWTSP